MGIVVRVLRFGTSSGRGAFPTGLVALRKAVELVVEPGEELSSRLDGQP